MIYTIDNLSDPLSGYLKDDPVRPHIPLELRFGPSRRVLALREDDKVKAMVCAKLCQGVPSNEVEMLLEPQGEFDTIVFYTIWSYAPGAGQRLLRASLELVKQQMPEIKRFVTLSPHTEMARRFHINNGASVFRINLDTVNYEYI
jgi:hypothetical protein